MNPGIVDESSDSGLSSEIESEKGSVMKTLTSCQEDWQENWEEIYKAAISKMKLKSSRVYQRQISYFRNVRRKIEAVKNPIDDLGATVRLLRLEQVRRRLRFKDQHQKLSCRKTMPTKDITATEGGDVSAESFFNRMAVYVTDIKQHLDQFHTECVKFQCQEFRRIALQSQ